MKPYYEHAGITIYHGDCREILSALPVSVIDPYCGSGPVLKAAKDAGMSAVGIEIEERYCEIAARRLTQEAFQFL